MIKRIIEVIALLLGVVITIGVVIAIPLKSYNEYKEYLAEIDRQNAEKEQAAKKPVLESITASLKEGVTYFANDIAEAKPEHFIVTANYTKDGEEPWSEPVEEDKFSVRTNADFYSKGGTITISYKSASATLEVALEPVVLESIEIAVNPYSIKYAVGDYFDDSGMIVRAIYNDGSSKLISSGEYFVDTEKILTASDKAVSVTYTDGGKTQAADVSIEVSETLNNGSVASVVIVDGAIVNAGDVITNAVMEVNAVYENGNRKLLTPDEYTISGTSDVVEFGKKYELTVSYNADKTKTASTDVVVRQTLQGEDGIIVGGSVKTEGEYAVVDGVITELGNEVSFAGNFSSSVKNGNEGSLTLVLNSAAETVGDITMRCSNSYNVYFNGSNADDGYMMKPLQINTILNLTVNGREVKVPATVILRGCGPYESYAPLYGIYYEFTFEGVELDAGVNYVKFDFKKSTQNATNCWGESPSTLNIDYVHFDSLGSEIPDGYTVEGLEISSGFAPEYAQKFDAITVPVVAIINNGSKIAIDPELYDVEIIGGENGDDSFKFGKYTVKITLKSNPQVTASAEYEIEKYEKFVVLHAGVELVGDRVYYVFSGDSVGYTAEDIIFFDGNNTFEFTAEFDLTTFVLKIDVTDMAVGTQIYPHLKIDEYNYENGANGNGDVRGNGLQFTDGQNVVLGGKKYSIVTGWSMPTLVIESYSDTPVTPDPDPTPSEGYDAELDDTFVSDKELLVSLGYGSEGVETNGKDKTGECEGGIGGLDQIERYAYYTFTLTTAGKVDIIWNIAGNHWSGGANLGIEDAGNHMTVTLNGKTVDMSGIALPAGEGDDIAIWWNVKQVVIKDVSLAAGTYTFKCDITTKGAGLNAGMLEVYFAEGDEPTTDPTPTPVEKKAEIQSADLFVEGEKVYYTLTYTVSGYDPATFEFFDKVTIYDCTYEADGTTVTFKFDVTNYTEALWPHLRIDGANWDGSKGDVKVPVTEKSVELGGKTYTLKNQYEMPTVVVS